MRATGADRPGRGSDRLRTEIPPARAARRTRHHREPGKAPQGCANELSPDQHGSSSSVVSGRGFPSNGARLPRAATNKTGVRLESNPGCFRPDRIARQRRFSPCCCSAHCNGKRRRTTPSRTTRSRTGSGRGGPSRPAPGPAPLFCIAAGSPPPSHGRRTAAVEFLRPALLLVRRPPARDAHRISRAMHRLPPSIRSAWEAAPHPGPSESSPARALQQVMNRNAGSGESEQTPPVIIWGSAAISPAPRAVSGHWMSGAAADCARQDAAQLCGTICSGKTFQGPL